MLLRIAGILGGSALAAALALPGPVAAQGEVDTLNKLFAQRGQQVEKLKVAQARIEALADQRDDLVAELRSLKDEVERRRKYNGQVQNLISSQDLEVASLKRQIEGVTGVERDILPLMGEMIDTLAAFIEADLPFLLDERRARVAELREIMTSADVTNGERYRKIMEAYQLENSYGRFIERYEDTIEVAGVDREVEFLKIGRIALLYQSLDGEYAGRWDQSERTWKDLEGAYRSGLD